MCVCVCILNSVEKLVGQNKCKKIEEEVNAACQGHLSDGLFGHACHNFARLRGLFVWRAWKKRKPLVTVSGLDPGSVRIQNRSFMFCWPCISSSISKRPSDSRLRSTTRTNCRVYTLCTRQSVFTFYYWELRSPTLDIGRSVGGEACVAVYSN
jgi:hypothetical protein